MKKTLIAYFSLEHSQPVGITHEIALEIQQLTGGDLFRIEPADPYPETFKEVNKEAALKKRENIRPALKRYLDNPDSYQTVFLAYPNYWGTMPMEVFAFVESLDFTGKKVYPICTHEGSGMGYSVIDLKNIIGESLVGEALALEKSQVISGGGPLRKYIEGISGD